ncbi:vanadium-dependent haloperoxidase [Mesorhizobium sp. M0028]|uniref:vanadium-dependent haloperoxidase n=1 Tax=Mesorhizobium sp. M0028 TaxID=2956849 RepID=UPI00333CC4F2
MSIAKGFVASRRSVLLGSTVLVASSALPDTASAQDNEFEVAQEFSPSTSVDYRRHNARIIRRNNAANQPGITDIFVSPGRDTHFSKALRRVHAQLDDHNWGLAEQEAFDAMNGALDDAYRNALRHPAVSTTGSSVKTDFEVFDDLADYIGDKAWGPEAKPPPKFKFTNPLGGLAFEGEGLDPPASRMSPPPSFRSGVTAAEMIEIYWGAYLRDVPFTAFASSTGPDLAKGIPQEKATEYRNAVSQARADLEKTGYYSALGGVPENRFMRADLRDTENPGRFGFPGVELGPYLSQFLLSGTPEPGRAARAASARLGVVGFGTLRLSQRQRTVLPDTDYLYTPTTDRSGENWHGVHNGDRSAIGSDAFDFPPEPSGSAPISDREIERAFNDTQLFIRNPRDGANYVHFDKIYQEYLVAACILLAGLPRVGDTQVLANTLNNGQPDEISFLNALVSEFGDVRDQLLNYGNPYRTAKAQVGFATFGLTHIVTLLSEVSTRAHKAGWYHKWGWRRLRPEEFAGRIQVNLSTQRQPSMPARHPISTDIDPARTSVFDLLKSKHRVNSYLLPLAFPEGCPTHPAYPSGHATAAGACVTVLKALFNETYDMTGVDNPIYVPDFTGKFLVPAAEQKVLSVGGELNKLASNITTFREFAGVHWKSDSIQGMLVGEQVALKILIEQTASANMQGSRAGDILPYYRERRNTPLGAPFFRLTLFSGEAIDIVDGKIFRVDDAFDDKQNSVYNPQEDWKRTGDELNFSDLVRLQGFPRYD